MMNWGYHSFEGTWSYMEAGHYPKIWGRVIKRDDGRFDWSCALVDLYAIGIVAGRMGICQTAYAAQFEVEREYHEGLARRRTADAERLRRAREDGRGGDRPLENGGRYHYQLGQ